MPVNTKPRIVAAPTIVAASARAVLENTLIAGQTSVWLLFDGPGPRGIRLIVVDREYPPGSCATGSSLENLRLRPEGILATVCHACVYGDGCVNRRRREISNVQPACQRITTKEIVQQPYHGAIQDCGEDPSLRNPIIPLKAFVNHNGASGPVSGCGALHPEPNGVFCSTGKAGGMKHGGVRLCHNCCLRLCVEL